MTLVGAVGVDLEGQPDVGHRVGAELLADDAEDGIGLVAERKRGADNFRIAAEFALPESVADDDDVAAVGRVFLRREGAAENHGRAEEAEVRFGNVNAMHLLGHFAGEIEARTAEVVGGDILQHAGLLAPVVELGGRSNAKVAIRRCVHHLHHAVGIRIGERLEQHRVHHREDGGVGSDAEGERGNRGDGEGRIADEHAQGVAEVAEEIAHVLPPLGTGPQPGED